MVVVAVVEDHLVVESSVVPEKDGYAELVGGNLAMSASCDIFPCLVGNPASFRCDPWLLGPPLSWDVMKVVKLVPFCVESRAIAPEVSCRSMWVLAIGAFGVGCVPVSPRRCPAGAGTPYVEQ